VRIWRRDGVAAVDLAGKALESGAVGSRIRVKAAQGGAVLRGTVRGAGSVELDAPGSGGLGGDGG
jgi:flagella basal body P-ring formation protein FlgA